MGGLTEEASVEWVEIGRDEGVFEDTVLEDDLVKTQAQVFAGQGRVMAVDLESLLVDGLGRILVVVLFPGHPAPADVEGVGLRGDRRGSGGAEVEGSVGLVAPVGVGIGEVEGVANGDQVGVELVSQIVVGLFEALIHGELGGGLAGFVWGVGGEAGVVLAIGRVWWTRRRAVGA